VLDSPWRRGRFPILCFHGVSTDDEHECYPGFFLTPDMFRAKLNALRSLDANVLPLKEALRRVAAGNLPERAVVLTIDDGFYGAYREGAPILAEFGYHATVYLTTHYIHHRRPVFDNMCGYLLWKSFGRELRWDDVLAEPVVLGPGNHSTVRDAIECYARSQSLDSAEKDTLLADLADRLGIDYERLRRRRMLHLVSPDEIRSWPNVDFELHTHRHRVSRNKTVFRQSIQRNAEELRWITGRECRHLAYPGGVYAAEHPEWLRELGIETAVTCETGFATADSSPLLLPRVMDTAHLNVLEFESWVTGVAGLLPHRRYPVDATQFEGEEALFVSRPLTLGASA
jgi:peptidoglycan/xylan/chitin deacetylase (PgdA/CDA1 family)